MAKQLAKEIYELAESDKSWSSSDLKDLTKKQYSDESKKLRDLLKSSVKLYIEKSKLDNKCEYNLYANNFPVCGVQCVFKKRKYGLSKKYVIDLPNGGGKYLYIADEASRRLIDDVLEPLDFKWKLGPNNIPNTNGYYYGIIVTWDHWLK